MDRLDQLESRSVHLLREAQASFKSLALLWDASPESAALLWLSRRAFFGAVPYPLVHIEAPGEGAAALRHRDELVRSWRLDLILARDDEAEGHAARDPAERGLRRVLQGEALRRALSGAGPRHRYDHEAKAYVLDEGREPFVVLISALRGDEGEGLRCFSPLNEGPARGRDAAPRSWDDHRTDLAPGAQLRVYPLLDWTACDVRAYLERERVAPPPR